MSSFTNSDNLFWTIITTICILIVGGIAFVRCERQIDCEGRNGVFVDSDYHPLGKCAAKHLPEETPR